MPVFLGDGVVFGRLGSSWTTTEVTGIAATPVELVGLRCAFTVPGSLAVYVEVKASVRAQTATSTATVDLWVEVEGAAGTVDAGAGSQHISAPGGAGGRSLQSLGEVLLDPGDYTAKVYVNRTQGLGTITVSQPARGRQLLLLAAIG